MRKVLDIYFRLIRAILPNKDDVTSFGLDIGTNTCKIVEIKKIQDNFQLLNYSIEPITDTKPEEAVKKCLAKLGSQPESLYAAVSGKGTLIRYINMPKMSEEDLENSFAIEAEKYFPFAQDQIYSDFYILDPNSKSKQMEVLAAAAKKELVNSRLKVMSDLNISANGVALNSVALTNAVKQFNLFEEDKEKSIALLDMGDSICSLTILHQSKPRFSRDIYIGGADFTKRICNVLGVKEEEAIKIKCDSGKKRQEVVNACELTVMSIIEELRLSFDYFSTEKSCDIGLLCITGGASKLNGIEEILAKNLDVKVVSWNPLDKLFIADSISQEKIKNDASQLGVAIGLALYEFN